MASPEPSNTEYVSGLLRTAAAEHVLLLARLPESIARNLPVDAQGIQRAIDHLAETAGFSESARHSLIRPHAVNPAVLHARVFGADGLTDSTVIGAFVDGARVRAQALGTLADEIGGEDLGARVRTLLAENPPPAEDDPEPILALTDTYQAQEQAALPTPAGLDARPNL